MSIRSIIEDHSTTTEGLRLTVSSFFKDTQSISEEQINQDFYPIDPQKLIKILSDNERTKPLAKLLKDSQGQIRYLGTTIRDKDCIFNTNDGITKIEHCISTTKSGLTSILIRTPETFLSKIFSFFSSKPSLNSFMKSVSLGLMAHINNRIPPIGLYKCIQKILDKKYYFFNPHTDKRPSEEEIANQLLLYYCINPENLKNYLDDRFSKEKYRPTTEEVDSHTDLKAWCQSFKDSIVGTYFDEDLKNQIFQEVEKQKNKYDHALQCTQKYQHTIQEFFSESTQQNKFVAFKTCMSILKAQNQVFKNFSLDQFIEEIKEMYTESPANFKIFLNQYFKENFSFYDQDLIDKTYQMIKKIKEEDLEIELNCRIDYMKYNNNIVSDMKNEEIKQALFQISQKDQTEKQDQKENTEKLPGVLVKLVPATKHQNHFVKRIGTLVQILSPLQKAA